MCSPRVSLRYAAFWRTTELSLVILRNAESMVAAAKSGSVYDELGIRKGDW